MTRTHRLIVALPLVLLSLVLASLIGARPASAVATYTVTNTNNSGAGSLRQAITDANTGSGNTIAFNISGAAPHTIEITSQLPTISQSMTITGPGASDLLIDGANASRILLIDGAGAAVAISGLTFTRGKATPSSTYGADGGAIRAYSGTSLSIQNCVFTSNSANSPGTTASGGAISSSIPLTISGTNSFTGNSSVAGFASGSDAWDASGGTIRAGSSLTMTGTTSITSSAATGGTATENNRLGGNVYGGALRVDSSYSISGTLTISGTTATGGAAGTNTGSTYIRGGGVIGGVFYAYPGANGTITGLTISSTTVTGGNAPGGSGTNGNVGGSVSGAAIYVGYSTSFSLSDSSISNTTSTVGTGGAVTGGGTAMNGIFEGAAIKLTSMSTIDISNSTIAGSTGSGAGYSAYGGIHLSDVTSGSIKNSTISGNTMTLGAGIYITSDSAPSTLTIANSTISGNSGDDGTAVFADSQSSVALAVHLVNSTVAGNTATSGGAALYTNRNTNTIVNSIISGNTPANCSLAPSRTPASDIATSYSVVYPSSSPCGTHGTGVVTTDPLLNALGSNGGTTQTRSLQVGSPALGSANSATCQASPMSALDQRGIARPVADCDMGSYQRSTGKPGPLTFSSGDFGAATIGSASALTVTVTNSGALSASPSAITAAGTAVSVTGGTCSTTSSITSAASCTVALSWTPTASGSLSGASLTVAYPNGTSASNAVALSGTASAAGAGGGGSSTPTVTPTASPSLAPVVTPTVSPSAAPSVASTVRKRAIAGPISAVTGAFVAQTPPLQTNRAASRGYRTAPRVLTAAGSIVRIGMQGLPASTRFFVSIRVEGDWYSLGLASSGIQGRSTAPAFISDAAGTFTLRVSRPGQPNRYVAARVN